MRQPPGPMEVVGGDQLGQLRDLMLSRAGQMVQAGPPPAQSPESIEAARKYQETLQQPIDGAAKWWQMAAGFLSPTRTSGNNFSESLGNAMSGYARGLAPEEEMALRNQQMAAQLGVQQNQLADHEASNRYAKSEGRIWDYMKGRDRATAAGGNVRQFQLRDGTIVVTDKNSGEELRRIPPQESANYLQAFNAAFKLVLEKGEYASIDEARDKATQIAMGAQGKAREAVGNTQPAPGSPVPGAPLQQAPAGGQTLTAKTSGHPVDVDFQNLPMEELAAAPEQDRMAMLRALPPAQREQADRWLRQAVHARRSGNTDLAERRAKQLDEIVQPVMPKKDERGAGFKKAYGEKEAATMEKTLTESGELFKTNAAMVGDLNNLEGIFKIANMPEGEFAKGMTAVASGLKSFGIDVDPTVGPAQTANAIANGMALKMRTAGGSNLMPGAMSNFDAQLLQQMAPNLSQTQEGRMMLVKLMRSSAESQMRVAKAAQEFASKNGGVLTPEWRDEAMKLEQKEMAKRELMRREIMKKFEAK